MIEDLLNDLSTLGWTVSWAYQFEQGHWRVSIITTTDIGEAPGTFISHCADATTFAEALEDAMSKRAEATFEPQTTQGFSIERSQGLSLVAALGLRFPINIKRRV